MYTIEKQKYYIRKSKKNMRNIKDMIFERLEKMLPYEKYKSIRILYSKLTTLNKASRAKQAYFYSRKKSDEHYIIFRFCTSIRMLFSAGNQYVFMYDWAIQHDLIPVIDMELEYDYENYRLGRDNLWDYCFRQDITVSEALTKEWVLVEDIDVHGKNWMPETCLAINNEANDHAIHSKQENWREYYSKVHKFIEPCWKFQGNIIEAYNRDVKEKIEVGDCILGVFMREEFSVDALSYREGLTAEQMYKLHPLTYGIDDAIRSIKDLLNRWNCNKILLATMYQDTVECFKEEFGEDRLITIPRERISFVENIQESAKFWDYSNKDLYDYYSQKANIDYIERSISYAEEVLALSNCDYYVGGKGSGGAAALALNGGRYKDIFIWPDFHDSKGSY